MKTIQKEYDCVAGGYSVWNCPPPRDPKLAIPVKSHPDGTHWHGRSDGHALAEDGVVV
jgi:hypothetical protein